MQVRDHGRVLNYCNQLLSGVKLISKDLSEFLDLLVAFDAYKSHEDGSLTSYIPRKWLQEEKVEQAGGSGKARKEKSGEQSPKPKAGVAGEGRDRELVDRRAFLVKDESEGNSLVIAAEDEIIPVSAEELMSNAPENKFIVKTLQPLVNYTSSYKGDKALRSKTFKLLHERYRKR